jgi:hypothetical protein
VIIRVKQEVDWLPAAAWRREALTKETRARTLTSWPGAPEVTITPFALSVERIFRQFGSSSLSRHEPSQALRNSYIGYSALRSLCAVLQCVRASQRCVHVGRGGQERTACPSLSPSLTKPLRGGAKRLRRRGLPLKSCGWPESIRFFGLFLLIHRLNAC